ncbi:MAG: tetraacyldisaccharide 4'-kinase, partial [Selenomonadaceae bacterium]
GYKVVILNRGYRSKWHGEVGVVSDGHELKMDASYAGDEAFMLAKHLPQIPVLIGPERAISGQYAIDNYDAEVAILDDGFQHWQLQRDLDIVLVDAVNVFGNGYMLPRGTLREPMSHLARADVFLLTKVDQAADGSCQYIKDTISRYNDEALLLNSVHQPKSFIRLEEWADNIAGEGVPVSFMSGKRVMAVSAIGNPASFEHTIGSTGAEIIESLRFPDHHDFTADEFSDIISQAAKNDVEAIIITEKDAVKVPDLTNVKQELQAVVPIYVITITVKFLQGEEAFKKLIADRIRDHVRKG